YQGAKVIHPRAVEIAMQAKIPLRIRSTYSDSPGTLVTTLDRKIEQPEVRDQLVTGIAYLENISQIKVTAKKGQYNFQSEVFKAMANANISVDFINISPTGVVYTIPEDTVERAVAELNAAGYDP